MSTLREIIERNNKRRKSQVKEDVSDVIEGMMILSETLHMIQEALENLGMNVEDTPLMFYPEAINSLIHDKLKEVGAFPGTEATVRYDIVPPADNPIARAMPTRFKRVEIKGKSNDSIHVRPNADVA